jgi:hypothetical protein
VEFTDLQCQFCNRFSTQVFAQIKAAYIDTGKVRFVTRDFPLDFHPEALPAARAARCAGEQNKFWEMRDALVRGYNRLGPAFVTSAAEGLGLDMAVRLAPPDEVRRRHHAGYERGRRQRRRHAHVRARRTSPQTSMASDCRRAALRRVRREIKELLAQPLAAVPAARRPRPAGRGTSRCGRLASIGSWMIEPPGLHLPDGVFQVSHADVERPVRRPRHRPAFVDAARSSDVRP